MSKLKHGKHRNGKSVNNGHIAGATPIGDRYFVVAFEAVPHPLPPEESGDHHFFRPNGDLVQVDKGNRENFFGRWVHGMTVVPGNNGLKTFPRGKTRPLKPHEVNRALEVIMTLDPSWARLEAIFAGIETEFPVLCDVGDGVSG